MKKDRKGQAAVAAAVTLGVAALLLAAQLAASARRLDMGLLTRDAAALAGLKWYAGFFSNLGLMLWGAATALGGFGFWRLRGEPGTRAVAVALGAYAALSAFLGLDDMAQLHEEVIPWYLGLSERWVYLAEALLFIAWLVLNRRVLVERVPVVLVAALAGFGLSVGADLADRILELPIVIEDGAKLIGICNWVATGALLLGSGVRPAAEP